MYSGPKNRSMTSAALVLAGLFPPESDLEVWDEHLGRLWQPVPIHINTKITDVRIMYVALLFIVQYELPNVYLRLMVQM